MGEYVVVLDTNILVEMRNCKKEIVDEIFAKNIVILREVFYEFDKRNANFLNELSSLSSSMKNLSKEFDKFQLSDLDMSKIEAEYKVLETSIASKIYNKDELYNKIEELYDKDALYNRLYSYDEWMKICEEYNILSNLELIFGSKDKSKKTINKHFDYVIYKRMCFLSNELEKDTVFVTNDSKELKNEYVLETMRNDFKIKTRKDLTVVDFDEFIDIYCSESSMELLYDNYFEYFYDYICDLLDRRGYEDYCIIDGYDNLDDRYKDKIKNIVNEAGIDCNERDLFIIFDVKYLIENIEHEMYVSFKYAGLQSYSIKNFKECRENGKEFIDIIELEV